MPGLNNAIKDIILSLKNWRIFYLIGFNDIKKRYVRSRLGQFWLTLSLAFNISALGVVWAYLFKIPVSNYLPYIAFSIIIWTYISNCILEGANVFILSSSYMKELSIPKTSYVFSIIVRNLIILCHNLPILIPIYVYCAYKLTLASITLSLLGLTLSVLTLIPAVLFIGTISLRFRDFPNIIASLMQPIFYITPVMWKIELMPAKFYKYLYLNPFAVFLSICRDPFFYNVEYTNYLVAVLYLFLSWIIGIAFFAKFRTRINYWL